MTLNKVRLYKEFRALRTVWLLGLTGLVFLRLGPLFIASTDLHQFFDMLFYGMYIIICFVLGAMSFGNEFDHGTMPLLLAQPIPRKQIWFDKIVILALFFLSFIILNSFITSLLREYSHHHGNLGIDILLGCYIFLLAGIGGPFFSLYLRQTHLAVWTSFITMFLFTSFFPGLVVTFIYKPSNGNIAILFLLLLTFPWYVCGYILAHNKFLNLELTASNSWKKRSENKDHTPSINTRIVATWLFHNRWGAVLFKELQIQTTAILFGIMILLLWVVVAVLMLIGNKELNWLLGGASIILFRPAVFFALPLAIGASIASWERENGVADWQDSLPFSRHSQWAIKVLMGLVLTTVFVRFLGVILDNWLVLDLAHMKGNYEPADRWLSKVAFGALAASLYASTLTRSTLLSIVSGAAISMICPYLFLVGYCHGFDMYRSVYRFASVSNTDLCFIALIVYLFGYWNYIRRWEGIPWIMVQVVTWLGGAFAMGWFGSVNR